MIRGNKNQSLLYLRSEEQGIGKTTMTDFIVKHVLGSKLCYVGGSQPLISNFNDILRGKLLEVYEELENFGCGQWQLVSSRIKRDLTSAFSQYEQKGVDSITAKNIANKIINSNVDAIKDDDGRRIFILDLSNKRKGDYEYFRMIYDDCMNNEVGHAFYCYLIDKIDMTAYHDQKFPITQSKLDAFVKRLDSTQRFLKEIYVLPKQEIKCTLQNLYNEYVAFCTAESLKKINKIDFNDKLKKLNIKTYMSGGLQKFKLSYEDLLKIAETKKWLHETDEIAESPLEIKNLVF